MSAAVFGGLVRAAESKSVRALDAAGAVGALAYGALSGSAWWVAGGALCALAAWLRPWQRLVLWWRARFVSRLASSRAYAGEVSVGRDAEGADTGRLPRMETVRSGIARPGCTGRQLVLTLKRADAREPAPLSTVAAKGKGAKPWSATFGPAYRVIWRGPVTADANWRLGRASDEAGLG